jgi:hypothetical protein
MTSVAGESRRPRPLARGLVVAVVAVTAVVGCSKPAKLVPAAGSVQIGGKPADGIVVQFMPQPVEGEKRPTSFATTDAEGRFTLGTYDGLNGAVVGQHAVTLVDTLEERPAQGQRFTRPPRLDSKYATIGGGLTAEVVEGGPTIEITVPAAGRTSPK